MAAGVASLPGAEALASRRRRCPPQRRCGDKCCPAHAKCKRGKCKCNEGYTRCGKKCVDLETSPRHCGVCHHPCDEGETCVSGACTGGVECTPNDTRPCYSGPPATENVGVCKSGVQTCTQGGQWGPCEGEVLPGSEVCSSGQDSDCNGATDPECQCASVGDCPDRTSYCRTPSGCTNGSCQYSDDPSLGQACIVGVGACQRAGVTVCDGNGNAVCNATPGTPQPETCNNIDDNCNGIVDDNPIDANQPCDCPGGTTGVTQCVAGVLQCFCP